MDALLLLKASLLLLLTLAAARLLRRAPAASRHRLWTLAFAAVLALPILAVALPALEVPMPSCCDAPALRRTAVTPSTPSDDPVPPQAIGSRIVPNESVSPAESPRTAAPGSAPGLSRPSDRTLLLTAWLAGTLAAAAALLLSLVRVRRLARAAESMDDAAWTVSAEALAARLRLRRPPRLFLSRAVGTPMAGGVWRPAIFLPASARGWSAERRDVVLAHEIAHLAGHDPLRHLTARLAVAFYWFHPLAWIAARQAVAAREQACDEVVLALGTRPSAYARVLLELADTMGPSRAWLGALPMVQRSHLETRLMAILNDDLRTATRRSVWTPAIGVALCTFAIAAAQPGVRASAPHALSLAVQVEAPRPVAVAPKLGQLKPLWLGVTSPQAGAGSPCWRDLPRSESFSGSTSSRDVGGRTVIYEQIGTSGADRIIQKSFGDLRVCMVAEDAGDWTRSERPSQWLGRARRVVLETRRGRDVQRFEVAPYGTGQRISWQVGGTDRPFDAAAQQWRDRMLEALDTTWEISSLRGEVSTLRGEVSTIRGEESTLRGEISTLHGHISTLRGEQSTVRGEESTLRGEISTIRGHVSTLRGAISSAQGNISGLRAGGYRSDDSARVRDLVSRYENDIAQIEREIRDYAADVKVAAVERQIAALEADKKVAAIDTEIRSFDLNGKVAAIEKQIAALDVEGKTAAIERQILALDADRRVRQLEDRRDQELKRLEAAIAAIR